MKRYLIPALVAISTMGAAEAADRPQIAPAGSWVLPPSPVATSTADPQAPVQLLVNDQQVRVTTDAVDTYVAVRARIQSPQGLQALGTFTFTWKPDSDVLTLHALTITHDGQTRDALGKGDTLTILRREDQLEQSVLTGALTAVIQPPGLQVGDVVELSFTRSHKDPVVADRPDGFYAWPNATIAHARLRVLWPKDLPLRWRASKTLGEREPVERDGWRELDYEADALTPPLQPTGAPPRFFAVRSLEYTTFASWTKLSQRMAPLYTKAATLGPDSPLHAEAKRIREQHATAVDRAGAALQLVESEIRYVLLAMNDGGLVPASADETWQRRFGDCKAKTVLLMALLRELGIESTPMVVSTEMGDGMNERLPAIDLFNHVLLRTTLDGRTYWLDGTRLGDHAIAHLHTPPFRWALPLTARGSELVAMEEAPLADPQALRTLNVDAREGIDLPAPFEAKFVAKGDLANALKLAWDGVPDANRDEGLRDFWRKAYRGLDVQTVDTHFDAARAEFTISARGTMKMEWDAKYLTYEPHDMSLGYRADFTRPKGSDIQAPYRVEFPVYTRSSERIRLPSQAKPFTVTGTDIATTIAGTEYRRNARVEDGVFIAESSIRSIAAEFPASEAEEAKRALLEMSRNDLYLKKPSPYLPTSRELAREVGKPLDSAQAYVLRGGQFQARNLHEEAIGDYGEALKRDPTLELALTGRAMSRVALGRQAEAREDLKAALAINADNSIARRMLAFVAMSSGNFAEARQMLTPVVEKEHAGADLIVRGQIEMLMGTPELALADYDAAIAADPRIATAYAMKAELLRSQHRDAEIPLLADALVKANEDSDRGVIAASDLLQVFGERVKAEALLGAQLRRKPSTALLLRRVTLTDRKSDVLADLATARKLDPDSKSLDLREIETLVLHGWHAEALAAIARLEAKAGVTADSANFRGVAYWQAGRKDDAAAAFAQARAAASQPMVLNNMCWSRSTYGAALEEALQDCDAAIAKLPACAACLDSRGFVLLRLGRLQESVKDYDRALELRPLEAASLFGRGIARMKLGQKDEAARDLATARIVSPGIDHRFAQYGVTPF